MKYRHSHPNAAELAENLRWLPGLGDPDERLRAATIYMEADVSDCDTRAEAKDRKYAAVYAVFPHAGPRDAGLSGKAAELAAAWQAVVERVATEPHLREASSFGYAVAAAAGIPESNSGNSTMREVLRAFGCTHAARHYHRRNPHATGEAISDFLASRIGVDDSFLSYSSVVPRDGRLDSLPKIARP
jgi:hypothetical protein